MFIVYAISAEYYQCYMYPIAIIMTEAGESA